jgi:hypothetical protein
MSLSLLRFTNEIRASNPFAKVDVEGSNPFSRSKKSQLSQPVGESLSTGFFLILPT